MNRFFVLNCLIAVISVSLVSCGGGSKSGLKKNEFFGSLPAIHADLKLAEAELQAKAEKALTAGNIKEAMKLEEESKKIEAKFEADVKAELAKTAGKDIPFSFANAAEFDKLPYSIVSIKTSGEQVGQITVTFLAKEELRSGRYSGLFNVNGAEYPSELPYKALAKDGSLIDDGSIFLMPTQKGESNEIKSGLSLRLYPEKWVDFASLEF